MTTFESAKKILGLIAAENAFQIEKDLEEVELPAATGRISGQRITCDEYIPAFANSSVDGFAVKSKETLDCREFPVLGTVVAGDAPLSKTDSFGVFEIMTGAPFPDGFDAAVKIEDVDVVQGSNKKIRLHSAVAEKENYRKAGEDFAPGSIVCQRGRGISPEVCMALAAVGTTRISVFRKPKVAVLVTGSELAESGERLTPGKIRDTSSSYLRAVLQKMGVEARFYGRVADRVSDFVDVMKKIISDRPDVILTTGAVSMGIHDFVAPCVRELGGEILFHRVAIRPAKPILFARFPRGPVLLGLPGNPVSTAIGVRFFLSSYLQKITHNYCGEAEPIQASLINAVSKPEGIRCFFKSRIDFREGKVFVEILSGQPSFMVSSLLSANGWAVVDEKTVTAKEGTLVDVYKMGGEFL
jgi:molybdopterin molybdotransferase